MAGMSSYEFAGLCLNTGMRVGGQPTKRFILLMMVDVCLGKSREVNSGKAVVTLALCPKVHNSHGVYAWLSGSGAYFAMESL